MLRILGVLGVVLLVLGGCQFRFIANPEPNTPSLWQDTGQTVGERVLEAWDQATKKPYAERYEVSGFGWIWGNGVVHSGGTGSVVGRDPHTLRRERIEFGGARRHR